MLAVGFKEGRYYIVVERVGRRLKGKVIVTSTTISVVTTEKIKAERQK